MVALKVRLLGGFELSGPSGTTLTVPTRKAKALLAMLAREPGEFQARETLAGTLWPESSETRARSSLRQSLKLLRRALCDVGPKVIVGNANLLALEPAETWVDVTLFEQLSEAGTPDALEKAAALYRGDFLATLLPPSEPFAEWAMLEQTKLRERANGTLGALLRHYSDEGEWGRAIQTAVVLLGLDPLREDVHRELMRLYQKQGRRGAALQQYNHCKDVLWRDLGVRPEPDTEELYQQIRNQAPTVRLERSDDHQRRPVDALLNRPAVAVLPFKDLTDDPGGRILCDGLAEEVIGALAGWRCFPLVASRSTFTYRDKPVDAAGIADQLHARYLVEGSVRRSTNKVRVTARLIEGESGHYLWMEKFDLAASDILELQEEAAKRIAAVVEPELEKAEFQHIIKKQTEDLSAWECYIKGMSLLNLDTTEGNARARALFDRAIRLDPTYSDGFMGLAFGFLRDIGADGSTDAREELLARGRDAAQEAVALDSNSSAAHLSLGTAYVWSEDFDAAMAETEAAIELNPSNAHARLALGNRLDLVGRTVEGIMEMERSLYLNPRDPHRWAYMSFLARAHTDARHYEEALGWAQEGLQLKPDQPDQHFRLAVCLGHLGRAEEARGALARCERLRPGYVAKRAAWRPYADPSRNQHFFAGLRKLGLLP
jgi:DNA-binding SARP family transcriptional activator/cytochrome c-type biogenesis protein CcmH/NrfG